MHQLVGGIRFEHLLFFLDPQTQDRAEKVSQLNGIVRAQHHQTNFGRHLRQISQRLLNQRLHIALRGFDFFSVLYCQFGKNAHAGAQKRRFLRPLFHANAIRSLDDQVQRVFDPLHAFDHHQRADLKQLRGFGVLIVRPVGPHADAGEQFFFAGQRGFNRGDRRRTTGRERHHRVRKQSCVAQRQDRNLKRFAFVFRRRFDRATRIVLFFSHQFMSTKVR